MFSRLRHGGRDHSTFSFHVGTSVRWLSLLVSPHSQRLARATHVHVDQCQKYVFM